MGGVGCARLEGLLMRILYHDADGFGFLGQILLVLHAAHIILKHRHGLRRRQAIITVNHFQPFRHFAEIDAHLALGEQLHNDATG